MKRAALLLALCVAAIGGCKSRSTASPIGADAATATTATKLTDLSTSLDAMRADFNAHKQEARFIALLSPA
jgi:hypothetical protein